MFFVVVRIMTLLKNVRALILIVLSLASIAALFLPIVFTSTTVTVSSVVNNANCVGISIGSRISQVDGKNIKSASDFNNALNGVKKGDFVSILADSKPANCVAVTDNDVGLGVSTVKNIGGLALGLDIGGGVLYNYRPERQISQMQISNIADIIKKRANIFGFQDVSINYDVDFVKISASTSVNINSILYPGVFEARLNENINIQNGTGKIPLGTSDYSFTTSNNTIFITNQSVPIGEKFKIENVDFYLTNLTESSAIIEAVVFDNSGVQQILPQGSSLTYNQDNRQYMFQIAVQVSKDASDKFQKVTARSPTTLSQGKIIVDGFLVYLLDEKVLSRLTIPLEFTRQPISSLSIIGFSPLQEEVKNEELRVVAALQSGVIDPPLSFDSQQTVQPTKRDLATMIFGSSIVFSLVLTFVLPVARYKNLRGGFHSFLFILMEIITTVGIVYGTLSLTGINLVLSYFSVLGFSLAIIFSALHFMIIAEKNYSGREFAIRTKYRKLIGVKIMVYIISLAMAIFLSTYFDRISGVILFLAVIIDWLLVKSLFEKSTQKSL